MGWTIGLCLFFYFFGHQMGKSACMDYYRHRVAESTRWTVQQMIDMIGKVEKLNALEFVIYLKELRQDMVNGQIVFKPGRGMRLPGSVFVGGEDKGPVAG